MCFSHQPSRMPQPSHGLSQNLQYSLQHPTTGVQHRHQQHNYLGLSSSGAKRLKATIRAVLCLVYHVCITPIIQFAKILTLHRILNNMSQFKTHLRNKHSLWRTRLLRPCISLLLHPPHNMHREHRHVQHLHRRNMFQRREHSQMH
jgi:hypothetical protein